MAENQRVQYVYTNKIKGEMIGTRKNIWKDQLGNLRTAVDYELEKKKFYRDHGRLFEV